MSAELYERRAIERTVEIDVAPTAPLSERAVLAAWLSLESRPPILRSLDKDDFSDPWMQELYGHLSALDDLATGCGPFAVFEQMRQAGVTDSGKYLDVMELWETAPQTAAGSPGWFLDNMRESALLRAEIELGQQIAKNPYDAGLARHEHDKVAADLEARLGAKPDTSFRSHVNSAVKRYSVGNPPAVPTGLHDLDLLIGGLRPGGVTVVGARPGIGKSLMVTTIAANLCARGDVMVGFVSLEMDDAEVENRLIAGESGVDVSRLNDTTLTDGDWLAIDLAQERVSDWPLDIRCSSHSQADLRAFAAELAAQGKRRTVLILDYIQRVREDGGNLSRERHVSMVSNTLKDIAVDRHLAVLAVASMSRESARRGGRPRMSDLRDSGTIESDADAVVLLWQQDDSMDSDLIDGVVDKNRHGRLGETQFVRRGHLGRVDSLARFSRGI